MAANPALGLERMRGLVAQLPEHFLNGYRDGSEVARGVTGPKPRPTFVVGLGGSGIAADLARVIVEQETKVPFAAVRTPGLPSSADRDGLAILLSHSGRTWEVLRAYDEARRRSMRVVVVTSGGELGERAERDGVPLVLVNPDMPQRSAVGLILGSILGLLDSWFPESNESRVARIAERIRAEHGRHASRSGLPARLAERVGDRFVFVYAEAALLPLARRWATQIEENAKRLAAFDEVPEAFHNALEGWDRLGAAAAKRYAAILLEWGATPPMLQRSDRYLERVLLKKGAFASRVQLTSGDLLEDLLEGIVIGDLMSLGLAARAKIDPVPVEAISRYKDFLGGSVR